MRALIAVLPILALGLLAQAARADVDDSVVSVQLSKRQLMVTRHSGITPATNVVELPHSVKVKTNGVFTVNNGKERRLRDGQKLGADGMLTSTDGTVAPVADHLVMKGGRLTLVKDGESAQVNSELALPDGRRIKPDGTIRTTDGRIQRMLDGQITTLAGETIPTTDTATLIKGVVVLQKDGGRITLRRDQKMAMSDGTQVFGNGDVILPNGSQLKLAEGEILKLPGVEKNNR